MRPSPCSRDGLIQKARSVAKLTSFYFIQFNNRESVVMYNNTSFLPESVTDTFSEPASLPDISSAAADFTGDTSAPISTITVGHRRVPTMHTTRVEKPLATVTDIASAVRKRLAKMIAPELSENQKRKAKTTSNFDTAAKTRFESSVFDLNFSTWELGNPPRMLTFVVRGSTFRDTRKRADSKEVFFQDIAPDMSALVKMIREDFPRRFRSAFGIDLDAIFVAEFQLYGNPHFHILLCVPKNADGTDMLSNHPKGGRGNLSRFNSYNFKAWAELTLSDLSKQRPDLTRATGQGRVTHLLEAKDIKPAESIKDYVGRFVNYACKRGDKYKEKAFQHSVPAPYRGQLFNWWGIIGFTNKRHTAAAPEILVCRTIAADIAARKFFASLTEREVTMVEMPDGTKVDGSMWTIELHRHCLTGGTFERPLSREELRQLRRIIMAANQVPDEVIEPVINVERYVAFMEIPPAPWEREYFDVEAFTAWLDEPESDDQDHREVLEPVEDVRPLSELLELCGFTADEQARAVKTAERKARPRLLPVETDGYY